MNRHDIGIGIITWITKEELKYHIISYHSSAYLASENPIIHLNAMAGSNTVVTSNVYGKCNCRDFLIFIKYFHLRQFFTALLITVWVLNKWRMRTSWGFGPLIVSIHHVEITELNDGYWLKNLQIGKQDTRKSVCSINFRWDIHLSCLDRKFSGRAYVHCGLNLKIYAWNVKIICPCTVYILIQSLTWNP